MDDLDRDVAQQVVLVVVEGLRGGHDDGLAGVDAHRVDVLHVADHQAVVPRVAHDLVLQLLPAAQALVDDHLGRVNEGLGAEAVQLRLVRGEAAAEASEREGRAHQHRVADPLGDVPRLLHAVGAGGLGDLLFFDCFC